MKLALRITRAGTVLYAGVYDITDAGTFGQACADAYSKLMQEQFRKERNVGALMEDIGAEASVLDGALMRLKRVQ
jgi:hypothetical protein